MATGNASGAVLTLFSLLALVGAISSSGCEASDGSSRTSEDGLLRAAASVETDGEIGGVAVLAMEGSHFSSSGRMAWNPTTGLLYVSDVSSGRVVSMDVARRRVSGSVEIGEGCGQVMSSPDGRELLVSCAKEGRVVALDGASLAVIDEVAVCDHPGSMAFGPQGQRIFLGCRGERRMQILVDGGVGGRPGRQGLVVTTERGDEGMQVRSLEGFALWRTDPVHLHPSPISCWPGRSIVLQAFRLERAAGDPAVWGDRELELSLGVSLVEPRTGVGHVVWLDSVLDRQSLTNAGRPGRLAVMGDRAVVPMPGIGEIATLDLGSVFEGGAENDRGGEGEDALPVVRELGSAGVKRIRIGGRPTEVTECSSVESHACVLDESGGAVVLIDVGYGPVARMPFR
jgi:hypothetical protein